MIARIVVVGSINIDLVARVGKLPRPGETVHASSLIQTPGGKGANQVVAAARLRAATTMIGRIGDDAFGKTLLTALKTCGVDTQYMQLTHESSSGVAMIGVESSGQNAITVISGANAQLTPDDLLKAEHVFANADAVIVQLEVPLPTVMAACRIGRQRGLLVVLDPAPAPTSGLPDELLQVDVIAPNQSEAEAITGISVTNSAEAKVAARVLQGRGAHRVVVKLGEQGALAYDRDGRDEHVPAPQVKAIDSTAAGDAFQAALAIALVEGRSLLDATRIACAAGALATRKVGAQQSMPTREEVERMFALTWPSC